MSLQDKAMLANLTVRAWSARKRDKDVGDEVEKAATQVRSPVPPVSASGKELNSENDAEPDIKQYQGTGHRSPGAKDPGCQ